MKAGSVLIFDDDLELGEMVKRMAESIGFHARHVDEASAFFRELAEWRPEIVLLDWCMPRMGGAEVLSHVAALGSTVKIIVMSGLGDDALAAQIAPDRTADLCIAGALPKPFTITALRDVLRDAAN